MSRNPLIWSFIGTRKVDLYLVHMKYSLFTRIFRGILFPSCYFYGVFIPYLQDDDGDRHI